MSAKEIIDAGLYDAAVMLMDDDIREELHLVIAPCSREFFLETYMDWHREKYGTDFVV